MTTVAQGTSVTLNLSPNDAVTVTGAANTEGTVTVSRAGQAFVNPQVALSAVTFKYGPPASSKTYGPYDVGATVVIAATAGDVTYTLLSTGLNPSASASALLAQTNLAYPFPLPKWRKALADVIAGVADARVAFIGDSTTVGLLTGTGGLWARSASVVMGKLLAARGIPVNMNNCWGDQTRIGGTTYTNFDPRCALGSNWTSAAGGINLVGGSPIGNTAGSGTFSFTPWTRDGRGVFVRHDRRLLLPEHVVRQLSDRGRRRRGHRRHGRLQRRPLAAGRLAKHHARRAHGQHQRDRCRTDLPDRHRLLEQRAEGGAHLQHGGRLAGVGRTSRWARSATSRRRRR
jgi:hypothetical protein